MFLVIRSTCLFLCLFIVGCSTIKSVYSSDNSDIINVLRVAKNYKLLIKYYTEQYTNDKEVAYELMINHYKVSEYSKSNAYASTLLDVNNNYKNDNAKDIEIKFILLKNYVFLKDYINALKYSLLIDNSQFEFANNDESYITYKAVIYYKSGMKVKARQLFETLNKKVNNPTYLHNLNNLR